MGISGGSNNGGLVTGSASALNADLLLVDATYIENIFVQISGTFVGTATFQGTNDQVTWYDILVTDATNSNKVPFTNTSVPGLFIVPCNFTFFKITTTSYTSGTIEATVLITENSPLPVIPRNIVSSNGNELLVNLDGSINTGSNPVSGSVNNTYNYVSAVPSSTLTSVVTYTVPVSKKAYLIKVPFAGQNVAQWQLYKNASVIDNQWTYFGGNLTGTFDFSLQNFGLPLVAGDVIVLKVSHVRPFVGDFNGRIFYVEQNA